MKNKKLFIAYLIPLLLFAGMAFAINIPRSPQLINPNAAGVIYATSTAQNSFLSATTSPTISSFTATSTTQTSIINGLFSFQNATGTALSVSGSLTGYGASSTISTLNAGTFTCVNCVTNADLANSTISGVALGGTLFGLSATNGTLTFSATYTGAAAQTVGLNLGNSNAWTAGQTFTNATSTAFAVGSSGLMVNAATSTITQLTVSALTLGNALTVANGGTGAGTFTSNGVLYGNGTGALNVTGQGVANSVLWANAGAPSFTTSPTTTNLTATGNLNVTGSTTFSNLVTIGGSASTTGSLNIGQTLNVTGSSTFAGNLTLNGSATSTQDFTVLGKFANKMASSTCSSSLCTIDWNKGTSQYLLFTTNAAIDMNSTSSNPISGMRFIVRACNNGTGNTITFGSANTLMWTGSGGVVGATTTMTSTANQCQKFGGEYVGITSKYEIMASTSPFGAY